MRSAVLHCTVCMAVFRCQYYIILLAMIILAMVSKSLVLELYQMLLVQLGEPASIGFIVLDQVCIVCDGMTWSKL